jgi:hypothetical protein
MRGGREKGLKHWRRSAAYRSYHEPRLRASEQIVFDELRAEGWRVYRNGWPDFLAERDGQLRFIEVKLKGEKLSAVQKRIHRALRLAGIRVEVRRISPSVNEKFSEK